MTSEWKGGLGIQLGVQKIFLHTSGLELRWVVNELLAVGSPAQPGSNVAPQSAAEGGGGQEVSRSLSFRNTISSL